MFRSQLVIQNSGYSYNNLGNLRFGDYFGEVPSNSWEHVSDLQWAVLPCRQRAFHSKMVTVWSFKFSALVGVFWAAKTNRGESLQYCFQSFWLRLFCCKGRHVPEQFTIAAMKNFSHSLARLFWENTNAVAHFARSLRRVHDGTVMALFSLRHIRVAGCRWKFSQILTCLKWKQPYIYLHLRFQHGKHTDAFPTVRLLS